MIELPNLATELVRLNPDVIVTTGTPGAVAAIKATRTIPRVTARRESPGTACLRSSSRLPSNSGPRIVNPVTFPPGRARLATSPEANGIGSCRHNDGNGLSRFYGRKGAGCACRHDDVGVETDQLGRQVWEFIILPLGPSEFYGDVLALNMA